MAEKNKNPYILFNPEITGITVPKSTRKDNASLKMLSRMIMGNMPQRNITPEKPSTQKIEMAGYDTSN